MRDRKSEKGMKREEEEWERKNQREERGRKKVREVLEVNNKQPG